jgi:hypothetical protein
MSAYIVTDDHINVVVSWFIDYRKDYQLWYEINGNYGYMGQAEAVDVAQVLYSENVKSVNSRYNEQSPDEQYQFTYLAHVKEAYGIGEIAGALDCLEYQSCETDGYHTSDAYKIITSMRKHLLKKVQERELGDNTTWEISKAKGKFAKPASFEVVDRGAYNVD